MTVLAPLRYEKSRSVFTGVVQGILVQYTHGTSYQSVGFLLIPLVRGGKSNPFLVLYLSHPGLQMEPT